MDSIKIKVKLLMVIVISLFYSLAVGVTSKTSASCGKCVQLTVGGNPAGWGCKTDSSASHGCKATSDSCDDQNPACS